METRNQIILKNQKLAIYLARRIAVAYPYIHESLDDIINLSYIILIEAVDSYNDKIPLSAHLTKTIVWRLIDELRKLDPVPRRMRDITRKVLKDKDLSLNEHAKLLNIPTNLVEEAVMLSLHTTTDVIEDIVVNYTDYNDYEQKELIKHCLTKLPKDYRFIIYEHYFKDREFRDIAKELNISSSAISWFHKEGLKKLKEIVVQAT